MMNLMDDLAKRLAEWWAWHDERYPQCDFEPHIVHTHVLACSV